METENSTDTHHLSKASNRPTATILLFPRIDIERFTEACEKEIERILSLGTDTKYIYSINDIRDTLSHSMIVRLILIGYQIDYDTMRSIEHIANLVTREIGI
jgi:hypothetical protein